MYIQPTHTRKGEFSTKTLGLEAASAWLEVKNNFTVNVLKEPPNRSINLKYNSKVAKTLIYFTEPQFYHFFADFLIDLVKLNDAIKDPNHVFLILAAPPSQPQSYLFFSNNLLSILDSLEIKAELIGFNSENDVYEISNYRLYTGQKYLASAEKFTVSDVEYLSLQLLDKFRSPNKPYRLVYLSRRHLTSNTESTQREVQRHSVDRISTKEEERLEEILINFGYEILIPEQKFSSIPEQIRYMSEIKVLIAPSGSGLTNLLFLENHQVVVEILAEMLKPRGNNEYSSEYVSWYSTLAYAKHHTYIAIEPNKINLETLSSISNISRNSN